MKPLCHSIAKMRPAAGLVQLQRSLKALHQQAGRRQVMGWEEAACNSWQCIQEGWHGAPAGCGRCRQP